MTRRRNARVAGLAFLVYIAAALSGMMLEGSATRGEGIAAKLAGIAQHAPAVRLAVVLQLVGCFCALVLGVTLYAITRDADPDLALLAMICRVAEGVIGAVSVPNTLGKLWLATAAGADAPDPAAAGALGAFLMKMPTGDFALPAIFFAVGSTIFASLLLRGRIVPAALAWLGLLASILVLVILPMALVGIRFGLLNKVMWLPMLVFEVTLALWLILKGAAVPRRSVVSEA
jgi:hypothetical protein